jgi:solute carrier family 6 (neurotransmitter transporter), invertebrate
LQRILSHHQIRSVSSPPISSQANNHRPRQSLPSETSSIASSRNSSPVSMVSLVSSTGSSSIPDPIRFSTNHIAYEDERDQNESSSESKIAWPHMLSRPICCLFCTLGLFNISRFAVFSVHFGGKCFVYNIFTIIIFSSLFF